MILLDSHLVSVPKPKGKWFDLISYTQLIIYNNLFIPSRNCQTARNRSRISVHVVEDCVGRRGLPLGLLLEINKMNDSCLYKCLT